MGADVLAARGWVAILVCTCARPEKHASAGAVIGALRAERRHLVTRIGEQRQQALALEVEAVRGPSDLGRPEEAQLALSRAERACEGREGTCASARAMGVKGGPSANGGAAEGRGLAGAGKVRRLPGNHAAARVHAARARCGSATNSVVRSEAKRLDTSVASILWVVIITTGRRGGNIVHVCGYRTKGEGRAVGGASTFRSSCVSSPLRSHEGRHARSPPGATQCLWRGGRRAPVWQDGRWRGLG